jgi:hypothetical protein
MEGMTAWIPQQPDLNAMEVYLWGPVINKVPSKIPQDLMARFQAPWIKLDASIYTKAYFVELMSVH